MLRLLTLVSVIVLTGCTSAQQLLHVFSEEAIAPTTFSYRDGGEGFYYQFKIGNDLQPDTFVFFYGGSGCSSWKYTMPGYVNGLTIPVKVFALNKRFVGDRSTGMFGCSRDFHLANHPDQWVADYAEFIDRQLDEASPRPANVVLVGVSEGALPGIRVAGLLSEITHLAIIGDGGYTMREALVTLHEKGDLRFDVDMGWKMISEDPRSIDKEWFGNTYRWWSDIMDVDPMPGYLALGIPILVGVGEEDRSVPVESARFLESQFKGAEKDNLTLKVYPKADHLLNAPGTSYRDEFFMELSRLVELSDEDMQM